MKVLFLDIDGVLATHKSWALFAKEPGDELSNPKACDPTSVRFIQLLSQKGVEIVVSSSWRKFVKKEELEEGFDLKIKDYTCSYPFPKSIRGDEIQIWLDQHPEVTHYCILDDDSDFLEQQKVFHIKPNFSEGLTFKLMENICEIFEMSIWDLRR